MPKSTVILVVHLYREQQLGLEWHGAHSTGQKGHHLGGSTWCKPVTAEEAYKITSCVKWPLQRTGTYTTQHAPIFVRLSFRRFYEQNCIDESIIVNV